MEPSSKKRHRLDITLEDVARECHVTMNTLYADVKRGKMDKNSLSSIISYINHKKQENQSMEGLIL